jgi:hypothetical protein
VPVAMNAEAELPATVIAAQAEQSMASGWVKSRAPERQIDFRKGAGADGYRVWRSPGCSNRRAQFRTTEAAAHPSGITPESFPIRDAEDAAASMCDTPQARHSNV